jgi:hypothetical protein
MGREESQRFSFFIFVKKVQNRKLWENIFDETKGYKDDTAKFFDSVKKSLDDKDLESFNSYSYDDFISFIHNVALIEGDYLNLERVSESIQKSDKFNIDKHLLEDKSQITYHKEKLVSNCKKVVSFPEILWVGERSRKIDADFWRIRDSIAYPDQDLIYSVKPIINLIGDYVKPNTINKISLNQLAVKDEQRRIILKYLIRSFIIYKAKKIGLTYFDNSHCLFFHHKYPRLNPERYYKGRLASKYFSKGGFVRHEALRIDVKELDDSFYAVFDMTILFTRNGFEVISGDSASALYKKFPKVYSYNDAERNKLNDWVKFLNFNITEIDNPERDYFKLSAFEQIESEVTYDGGEDFDTTLFDFFKEEKNETEEECPCE